MNFPTNVKYTKEHEWVRTEGNTAYVGITDFAQKELGEIVYVDVTTIGETLTKDEVFGTIEAVKTVSDLFMPIGGEVAAINEELEDQPEWVNESAYDKGWIIRIENFDTQEINELLSAEEYQTFIGQ